MKRAFLLLASAAVGVIALLYGLDPARFARNFLAVTEPHVSLTHILRAIMGLYLALAAFWLACALTAGKPGPPS